MSPGGDIIKVTSCEDQASKGSNSDTSSDDENDKPGEIAVSDVDSQNQTNATDTSMALFRSKLTM